MSQRLAFDEFSGDDVRAGGLANLVDRDDVRMIECGSGARLLFEASQAIFVGRERSGQEFQCDFATEAFVFREINLAHSATTDERDHLIGTEGLPGRELCSFIYEQRCG